MLSPTAKTWLVSIYVGFFVVAMLTMLIPVGYPIAAKVGVAIVMLYVLSAFIGGIINAGKSAANREKKIEEIEVEAEKEPEKTRFAWDLARVKTRGVF